MLRRILVISALAAASGLPGVANARHIPCLSEEVIKVADVPRDSALMLASQWGMNLQRIRPGYGVDLGYRLDRCSANGRWVGYIGYGETDFDLDDQQLHELARAAGMDDLPPAPGILRNPDVDAVLAGLVGAVIFAFVRIGAGLLGNRPGF
jgi:hypothetical protein